MYNSISQKLLTLARRNFTSVFSRNYEQNDVLLRYIGRIFVMDGVLGGNNVTLIGKIAHKQTGPRVLIDIGTVNRPCKQIYVKNELHIRSQYLRKLQNRQLSHYRQVKVQSGSVTSDNLRKVRMQRQRPDVVISIFTGCFIITVTRVSAHFGILGGDFSDKTMHHQNEQIIFIRVIGILDASLVVTGCHRGNTDSSPA